MTWYMRARLSSAERKPSSRAHPKLSSRGQGQLQSRQQAQLHSRLLKHIVITHKHMLLRRHMDNAATLLHRRKASMPRTRK